MDQRRKRGSTVIATTATPPTPRSLGAERRALELRRLAILETHPIRTLPDLHEWRRLRKWVIDEDLLDEYRDQDYFRRRNEITKSQLPPKNPRSIFSRFLDFISLK